jgi:Tfp pilus assembly protein FimT
MRVWDRRNGYSVAELMVVVGIIGILGTLVPVSVGYLRAATALEAARELQVALSRAKQLAVTTRTSICVQATGGGYRFLTGSCAGPVITFPEAGTGTFRLSNGATVSAGPNPIFTPFGTVTGTGPFTITTPGGTAATVTVAASGRITVP